MIRAITPVAALLLGVAILLTGQGLQGVLLPVRADLEGFSTLAVGFIGAAYFLGFTVGCLKGTALIRNVGHVRVFAAMTALASASPLLQGFWVNLWSWGLLRVLTGYCFAVLYVVIESWLNERASNENRGTVFSAYVLINMTVLAVGQQMLLLSEPSDLSLFAAVSVLVSLAAVPVALSTSESPRQVEDARLDFRYAFSRSKAGLLGSLASGLANGSFWALAPVFAVALSGEVSTTAWFMTAGVLGGAAGQFPLGRLSDRVDRRYVMLGVACCSALVSAAIWMFAAGLSPLLVMGMGFLWGAFSFPLYSISVAHANDRAAPDRYVMISSVLLLMYGVGAISGPFLASGFMGALGPAGLFAFIAVVNIGAGLYLVLGSLSRKAVAREQVGDFEDALTSALTASRIYEQEHQAAERRASRA
jgi:MFS family permease